MTKRYSTLQKKLQELQSQLLHITTISTAGDPIPQFLSHDIQQRFAFLNNLLSAEIASSPSKPHHLHHIAHKLADLESTFRDLYRSPAAQGGAPAAGDLETNSNYSCTESCLNEEEEEEAWGEKGSGGFESPEGFYAAVEEQPAPAKAKAKAKAKGEGKGEKGFRVWEGRDWMVMGSGVIIGAVLMGFVMLKFCGGFHPHYNQRQGFVAPT